MSIHITTAKLNLSFSKIFAAFYTEKPVDVIVMSKVSHLISNGFQDKSGGSFHRKIMLFSTWHHLRRQREFECGKQVPIACCWGSSGEAWQRTPQLQKAQVVWQAVYHHLYVLTMQIHQHIPVCGVEAGSFLSFSVDHLLTYWVFGIAFGLGGGGVCMHPI